jgi:hypothetical protein
MVAVKNLDDEAIWNRNQRGSTVRCLCDPWNRALDNKFLMNYYFVEVPVYPLELFCSCYRMRQDLSVRIVKACESTIFSPAGGLRPA